RSYQGRSGQREQPVALLHLRECFLVLRHAICCGAYRRAAGRARFLGDHETDAAGQASALPMIHSSRLLETTAAWLLALLWIATLLYAVWAAVHPPQYAVRFALLAPLTLDNFLRAWEFAP